jgi:hypothetical protein
MPVPPLAGPPVAVTAATINALLRSGYDHQTGWEYADLVPVSPSVASARPMPTRTRTCVTTPKCATTVFVPLSCVNVPVRY